MQQRVLHVLNGLGTGGIEKYILDLFQQIDPEKYVFDFLLRKKANMHEQLISSLGGRVYYVSPYPEKKKQNYKDVDQFFDCHKEYNIVHMHMNSLEYITILKLAKKHQVPNIILHSHNSSRVTLKARSLHYCNRFLTRNYPTERLACSDKAADWMFGNKSYMFVSNGINTEQFRFNQAYRDEIRQEFSLGDKYIWGHVGRLSEIKNQKFVIDLFSQQAANNPNSMLILVGEGRDEKHLKEYVESINLSKRILFLGVRNDVYKLLSAMDVMVFPSLAEGFPISIIEAQCSGLRCVLADTITSQVAITDKVDFLSLNDEIAVWNNVISQPESLSDRINYYSIVRAAGFDLKETSKRIEHFYDDLTSRNNTQ